MTATAVPSVSVIRPDLPRAPFAVELAAWVGEGVAAHPRPADGRAPRPVVVIVPEYLHGAPQPVLDDLGSRVWTGRTVALVGYGGRSRARHALEDVRDLLARSGATVVGAALGVDAAQVLATGFDAADVLLRDHLLDELVTS